MSTPADYMTHFVTPAINDANAGLSIYQGATSGNPASQTRAGLTAARAYGRLSGNSGINTGATGALDALGIYQGLQQGGVQGYGRAAGSGLQLAGLMSNNPELAQVGGYVMAPLAVYNAVNNWQSGKTGSNALNGAEAGAAVGSVIPGIGTVIGGLVGGAVGALSSAFGPGAKDPETADVQGLIDYTGSHGNAQGAAQNAANPYLELAGLMDRRESTLPMYQQYGRMGEQKFTQDLTGQINDAINSGLLTMNKDGTVTLKGGQGGSTTYDANAAGQAVYNNVVAPWVNKMGSGWGNVGDTYKATTQGLLEDMTNQYLHGQAAQDWKAVGGDSPFASIYSSGPLSQYNAPTPQTSSVVQGVKGGQRLAGGGTVRKRHYDDGGDVSVSDAGAASPDWQPELQNISDEQVQTSLDQPYWGTNVGGGGVDPYNIVNAYNDPYAYGGGDSGSSSGSGLAGLGNLLKGLGMSGSTLNSLAPYAALLPLLQSVLGGNKGAQAPGVPSQYSGQLLNMQTPPAFNRQQNPMKMSQDQWLHSAEGPELGFYKGNQLPITPMSAPNAAQMSSSPYTGAQTNPYSVVQPGTPMPNQMPKGPAPQNNMNTQPIGIGGPGMRPIVMAQGGLARLAQGGASFDSTGSGLGGLGHVKGPGDGTSDSIQLKNAYLSNGEYVIDAPTVSMAGNGSNDAGAKVFDRIRSDIRKHGGKALAKGKQPMTAKQVNVANYMGGGR